MECVLFCLPYAGGDSTAFWHWRGMLPSFVRTHFVELPGRDGRTADPAEVSPREVAELVAAEARNPYAIYGHSMGARLAFEVTRELVRMGAPPPLRLYVGGAHPPHLPEPIARIVNLTEDEFIDQLVLRAGAPAELREDADVRAALMPALRADLGWLQRYRYRPGPISPAPIVAFAGSDDREVSADEMLGWARHTSASFRLHTVAGDHMFIRGAGETVTSQIAADLAGARSAEAADADLPLPADDEIQVWRAALDRMPEACEATRELSDQEAATAAAFDNDTDRRRYIGRRALLRRLLRRYGADPWAADALTDPRGALQLARPAGLRCAVSHSDGAVLMAFSRGHEISVDVARLRPTTRCDAFRDSALTAAERAEIAAEPEEAQQRSELRFHTAKRALIGAAGDDPGTEPSRLCFAGAAPGRPWRLDPPPDLQRLAHWRVRHLELEGVIGAVASPRDRWRLRFETLAEGARAGAR